MSAVQHAHDPIDRWLRVAREITAFRNYERADYATYDRLKAEFVRLFPQASPQEYERAMHQLARMTGV